MLQSRWVPASSNSAHKQAGSNIIKYLLHCLTLWDPCSTNEIAAIKCQMLHRTSTFSWVRQCSQSLWRTKLDGDQVHVSQILLHYYNPREHYCVLLTRVNYIKEERLLNHTEQVTYVLCGHHDLGSTHTLDLWMHSIDLSSDVCKKSWYSGWDGIGACSAGYIVGTHRIKNKLAVYVWHWKINRSE